MTDLLDPIERKRSRAEVVAACMADIRAIDARAGTTREGVAAIRDRLIELSRHRELFTFDDFPHPTEADGRNGCLYRLSEDDDHRFALYVNSSRTSYATPAHNHTTWAVVVGCEGEELNRFYERTPEGHVAQVREELVEYGTGVAMLGDDLHSIHIDAPALNFHCYGLALEQLTEREYYSEKDDAWKIFPPNSDIREARLDLQNC